MKPEEVIVLTSDFAGSGVNEFLKPVGIIYGYEHSSKSADLGRGGAVKNMQYKAAEANCKYVFNCKFDSWTVGHPNNNDYGSRVMGDAYRLA